MNELKELFASDGFALVSDVLSDDCCEHYCQLVETAMSENRNGCVSNSSSTFGVRNLTDAIPEVVDLFQHKLLSDLVQQLVGQDAFMVRATLFDKTESANWGVFWHQDLAIAVQQRQQVKGFDGWTKKAGVVCCQPPAEVMHKIVAVRLHLDDCPRDNGALKVLRGSHAHGRIAESAMGEVQLGFEEVICEVARGGAVIMNPLSLHASSPKTVEGHRRVIHFEFTAQMLPDPLEWSYQIPLKPL
ncbi:MAG: phytanoyl-CoA dioxygenase family protein [Fuerstiella sp.]